MNKLLATVLLALISFCALAEGEVYCICLKNENLVSTHDGVDHTTGCKLTVDAGVTVDLASRCAISIGDQVSFAGYTPQTMTQSNVTFKSSGTHYETNDSCECNS